ncbi:MAG: rane protein of unknown function [Steroidobacteraceae bacterium]|jgi:hypothetical protein|nr:rane protein of unknown function [Steroidobacteraceae bacterium]
MNALSLKAVSLRAVSNRQAAALLWGCVILFAARVIGQLETVLLEPRWLPTMDAWFSGLLPYPLLLPIQIGILMLMAVVAGNPRVRGGQFAQAHPRAAATLRTFAVVYFVVMAVRLAVNISMNGADFWSEGAIPVAFHWVLALFILVSGRGMPPERQQEHEEANDIPYGDVPAMAQPLAHRPGLGQQV